MLNIVQIYTDHYWTSSTTIIKQNAPERVLSILKFGFCCSLFDCLLLLNIKGVWFEFWSRPFKKFLFQKLTPVIDRHQGFGYLMVPNTKNNLYGLFCRIFKRYILMSNTRQQFPNILLHCPNYCLTHWFSIYGNSLYSRLYRCYHFFFH